MVPKESIDVADIQPQSVQNVAMFERSCGAHNGGAAMYSVKVVAVSWSKMLCNAVK
jgi:hypothetical protein